MEVKCIDNENFFSELTLERFYNVIKRTFEYFTIINDNGDEKRYSTLRFETNVKNSLPERWAIKSTIENRDWVIEKYVEISKYGIYFFLDDYYIFDKDFKYEEYTRVKPSDIPELTLADLKEHFKENIIGYIAPFDMYESQILKGEIFTKSPNSKLRYCPNIKPGTPYELPKEIVEQWEPVYRPTEKTLSLSSGNVVIKKDGVHVAGVIVPINEIKCLLEPSANSIDNWSVSIKDVAYKIGCWENVTKKDLDLIIKAYEEINTQTC